MKKSEEIFVLHGDVNRKSKILTLLGGKINVVVWPGTDHNSVKNSLVGFDDSLHTILEIGSREKLYIGRNNILDYAKKNGIKRFWMIDDDVGFRLGGPSQEFKDAVFHDGKYWLNEIRFDDDVGLGGMTMAGVMFNNAIGSPEFSNRFVWATVFIDLDYNNVRYSIEGYDDIDMQLECVKRGIKTQTTNWIGQIKPNWLTKKSLNSQVGKINQNNFNVYEKWGDTVKIDVYYDKQKNKYFRVHVRWPYKIVDSFKFNKENVDKFVQSLEEEYANHPDSFHVCGLPHMKKDRAGKPPKEKKPRAPRKKKFEVPSDGKRYFLLSQDDVKELLVAMKASNKEKMESVLKVCEGRLA